MNPNVYEHDRRIPTDRKAFTGVASSLIEQVLKLCPDTERAMFGLYIDKHFPVLLTLGQASYGENLGFEGVILEYKNEVILFVPLNYSPSGSWDRLGGGPGVLPWFLDEDDLQHVSAFKSYEEEDGILYRRPEYIEKFPKTYNGA